MTSAIVILNWNGWKDTIECLESLFRLISDNVRIIVCDNASSDSSLQRIKDWANGHLQAQSANPNLGHLISPPISKPIPFRELTRGEAEFGNQIHSEPLVLIQTGANLGFAGGCNVGLRYALHDLHCEYFWLLNNDTVVPPDSLSMMIEYMREHRKVGLCGSLNLSYHEPSVVQAEGGKQYRR